MMRKMGEASQQPINFCKKTGFTRQNMVSPVGIRLSYCTSSTDNPHLFQNFMPATYSNTLKYGRVYIESLLDFAHSAFDDYRTLSVEEKVNTDFFLQF